MLYVTGISVDNCRLYLSDGTEKPIVSIFNIDAIDRTLDFINDGMRRCFSPDTLFCNRVINIHTKDSGDTPLDFILKSIGVDESNFGWRSDISAYSILASMKYGYFKLSGNLVVLYKYIQKR